MEKKRIGTWIRVGMMVVLGGAASLAVSEPQKAEACSYAWYNSSGLCGCFPGSDSICDYVYQYGRKFCVNVASCLKPQPKPPFPGL
jgi:hypothetical protein